jgi:hypothetical protein
MPDCADDTLVPLLDSDAVVSDQPLLETHQGSADRVSADRVSTDLVRLVLDKLELPAPREQVQGLRTKLQKMHTDDPEDVKIDHCLRFLQDNPDPRLVDCLAVSHLLNDGKILIVSKISDENIDAYWEKLTSELDNDTLSATLSATLSDSLKNSLFVAEQ